MKLTKKKAIHIMKLLRRWTAAEVISRLGKTKGLAFGDYYMMKIQLENELREYLYGTSDLAKLGERWGLLDKVWEGPPRKLPNKFETKI